MWQNKKSTYKRHIGFILLLLIAVRVVPFGLLHYHNGKFADFQASNYSTQELPNNTETLLKDSRGSCSLHELLDIINNGFFVGSDLQIIETGIYNDNINLYTENRLEAISINILNKGSPVLI
jgi:hypothetical protein